MKKKLINLHIRIDEDVYQYAKEVAAEYKLSLAEVFRRSVGNSMESLVKDIRYLDKSQADEVRSTIMKIYDAVAHIDMVISGIGSNMNQIARINNTNRKMYENQSVSTSDNDKISSFNQNSIENDLILPTSTEAEKIQFLLDEYKDISKSLCEKLWRLVE